MITKHDHATAMTDYKQSINNIKSDIQTINKKTTLHQTTIKKHIHITQCQNTPKPQLYIKINTTNDSAPEVDANI